MNSDFPIYTIENECQDCYKCVRHCHCKAIRIVNARAAVIPELCVSCGECFKVCPAHAKKIRSDLRRAKYWMEQGETVYASVAPSFLGFFPEVTLQQLAAGLKRLGFSGASETALGAQLVSSENHKILERMPAGVYLSSACPAAVEYVGKYAPQWKDAILPVASPVVAHAKYLRKCFGEQIKVVFFGPCAAKKNEADRYPETLSLALTFQDLIAWMEEEKVNLSELPPEDPVPVMAEEGRRYSLEGGMNDTMRVPGDGIQYVAVSGLENIDRMLRGADRKKVARDGGKLFIEMLSCHGGCVNGPVMAEEASGVETIMKTSQFSVEKTSVGRSVPVDLSLPVEVQRVQETPREEFLIRAAMESVGKFSVKDELNCGGCGYNTCREFARAMVEGKAEAGMCLSWLRKISQRTSNALIRYIPAAVVIVDQELQILECNRHFAKLAGADTLETYDTFGNLTGAYLDKIVPYVELFQMVLEKGGEIERSNQMYGERIYDISIFTITQGRTVGAVIQDVTQTELRREQVAEKAREVIRKNVLTVQNIARCLGEHMAETEILLNQVASTYENHEVDEKSAGIK
ncbi:MAG: [Fe-Fe] hydrogenase large subunit C-terminal domain-containing protein [Planctomycetia bacterium]|nr:[Fe-Fe] hydrogenase large subunit C-terminal domain-containing protein [Planctomycetia bacterium]